MVHFAVCVSRGVVFWIALHLRKMQEGAETRDYTAVATGGESLSVRSLRLNVTGCGCMCAFLAVATVLAGCRVLWCGLVVQQCQAQAVLALLTKLHKEDIIDKYSTAPTERVCLPCIEVCLPGELAPLCGKFPFYFPALGAVTTT